MNGGTIYAARKRFKWPGVAAVVVSTVHLFKGTYIGLKFLERQPVERITAFLFAKGGNENPKTLVVNTGKSYVGSYVLGMGFTFDDSGAADDETPGIPSPIATMERLIAANPKNADAILPYIGGSEVNSSPTHAHRRYVINFGERTEEECWREWPDLIKIVRKKVKPLRDGLKRDAYRERWWQYAEKQSALYAAIHDCDRVLVTSAAAVSHHMINSIRADRIFSHKLIVFLDASSPRHMCMQSLFHEEWSRAFGATQGSADALTYNPTDVFLGFPFPLENSFSSDFSLTYTERRQQFLIDMQVGATTAYGMLHQPSVDDRMINEFRKFHAHANLEVANAYGWDEVPTACGFGLDYLDLEDDARLPEDLQERVDNGELFFWNAGDALDFQSQLQAYGAITGRCKLPWRYRWPDSVRDDVLARLLALNAERYEEELLQGEPESTQKNRQSSVSRSKKSTSLKAASSVQQPRLF